MTRIHRTVFVLVALVLLGLLPSVANAQTWYNSSWLYRKAITIDFTKVGAGPHTNYPVLVSRTDSDLQTKAQTDADDILFTSADGTTKLAHQIESYTSGTGAIVAWVQIPSLSSAANTVVYMYYGNAAAASQQNVTGTWNANYKGVWHLNTVYTDSTSNANNGTNTGTAAGTGKISGGAVFVRSQADYITVTGLMGSPTSFTLSAWATLTTADSNGAEIISLGDNTVLRLDELSASKTVGTTFNGGGVWNPTASGINYAGTGWHYVVFTFDDVANSQKVYVDGAQVATNTNATSPVYVGNGANTRIGRNGNTSLNFDFDGTMDEVRVSNSSRSAGWVLTEYNNQNAPTTFYSVGTEAKTYYSLANGNWNTAATWSNTGHAGAASSTAPGNATGDNVIVGNSNAVTLNVTVTNQTPVAINSTGTLNMGTNTIGGGGSFTLNSGGTLGIGSTAGITSSGATGNVQVTGTRTFSTGANYTYNGSSAQVTGNGLPATVNNLTINDSAGVTLNASVAVSADLTVAAGAFDLGSFTANRASAGGTLSVANLATLKIGGTNPLPTNFSAHSIGATSTVEYSGTTQSVVVLNSAQDYGNLTISGSGTKTLAGTENVAGNLTISAGTFDLGSFTANRTSAGGTLSLANLATLKIGGTNPLPTNFSTHSIGATSTVEYSGTTQSVVVLNSAQDYGNLTISGSGTKTLAGIENVAGDLTISGGTFDLGNFTANRTSAGGTLSVANLATLKIGGTNPLPTNFSTHSIGATSTVEYSGTTQSVVVLNSAQDYGNLTISGSGTKTLAGNENVAGNLTISAGTFDLSSFTANRTSAGGALSVANLATLKIGGTNPLPTNFSAHSIGATSTVEYSGTTQSVVVLNSAQDYGNLTISGSGTKTLAGIENVAGELTISGGTFDLGSFTANRTSAGGTLSVANLATLKIGGTNPLPTNFSAHSIGATSTVEYSGTTQSVVVLNSAQDYGNLTISGSGTKTLAGIESVAGDLTISGGTFDLGSFTANRASVGGTLSVAAGATLKIGGTNTIPSNFSTHSIGFASTIEYSGTNQTVAALNSAQEYSALTISGSGTKTLTGDLNVAGVLNLTSGTLTTGAYVLYSKASGNVFRASGWLIGNLKRRIATGTPFTRIFDVGDASNYTPVTVVFASITTAGDFTVSVVSGDHANIGSSTINAAKSVNRNWTLTNSGIVFTTYGATFTFVAGDVDGTANTANFVVGRYSAGWTYPTVGTKAATSTQATGLTAFGDFQIAEAGAALGAISGTVFEDTNYGGGAGRSLASSSGPAVPSARVELYTAAGNFSTFATSDSSGNYSFANLPAATYTVRVVNGAVNSSRSGTEVLPPVQTYRTNASSGTAVAVTDHVGGEVPASADAGNGSTTLAALTVGAVTPQSITSAVVGASNITGVDFGYSYDVIVNKNDAGQGSLRQFLLNANGLSNTGLAQSGLTSGIDNAVFMLADGSARAGLIASYATQFASSIASITVATVLPTITDPVILDASSQPGYAGAPMIELNGAAVATAGLTITAGSSTVRGFIINRFTDATAGIGISISSGGGNTITGNYIGTNAAGTAASANRRDGIFIGSSNNTVGGTTAAARNVISGNGDASCFDCSGLHISGGSGNIVLGNYIGINAAGTAALGNAIAGIYLYSAANNNTIGGTVAGAGNVISGNGTQGIAIHLSSGNLVQGNYIGTNPAGSAAIGNNLGVSMFDTATNNTIGGTTAAARNVISGNATQGVILGVSGTGTTGNLVQGNYIGVNAAGSAAIANSDGVSVFSGAGGNTIGGVAAGAGNLISGNAGKGVVIAAGIGNAVLSNSIYGNTGIGIDLANDGLTVNDGTKSGALANSGMDTPVFTAMALAGSTLTISGYVGSAASQATFATVSVQVFKADNDATGFGEGQTFLGTLTTDAAGNFSGTLTVSLATGDKITGTATDGSNNTSEFGANAALGAAPSVTLVHSVTPSGNQPPGTDLAYTVAFTNGGGQAAQVFIVLDPIPANTDFKLGSPSTVLATTGMTVVVEFSNDGASTWIYTPVTSGGGALAGYDRNVTHVRWRFTGNLSQTSPNNTGSVTLTARIR